MQPDPSEILARVEAAYRQHFEVAPVRASVSFVGVEPIEVLRYESHDPDGRTSISNYLSLGMSRYPMVEASAMELDLRGAPRAELLLSVNGRPDDVWRRLAVLAAAPAVESAVYGPGGRIDLGEPWISGSRCSGALLTEGPLVPISVPDVSAVQVFRLLPALPTELAWARVHGSEALMVRWEEEATELRDLRRSAVRLD